MEDKSRLYDSFINSSMHRLKFTRDSLLSVGNFPIDPVNDALLKRYLEYSEQRERIFLEKLKAPDQPIQSFDISDLETEVSVFLEDVVLKKKDRFGLYSELKCIFRDVGVYLVFYPSIYLESHPGSVFKDLFLIGVPAGVLNEREYVPLIFHEIGHFMIDSDNFKSLNEAVNSEIEAFQNRAFQGKNLDQVNLRYLNRASFYKRILKEWIPEIASDIFGAYFVGKPYLFAFLSYQMNKRYVSNIEDHPSNKIRFLFLSKYFNKKENSLASLQEKELADIINTDKRLDEKSGLLMKEAIQEYLFEGFESEIKRNNSFKEARIKIRKIFE